MSPSPTGLEVLERDILARFEPGVPQRRDVEQHAAADDAVVPDVDCPTAAPSSPTVCACAPLCSEPS
jgi:hypothetical protein